MRLTGILALACLLPGCTMLSTSDCVQERSALRQADAAIAEATRARNTGYRVHLASRGHSAYECAPARSGQVHCTRAVTQRAVVDGIERLYRKRDAAAARVVEYCAS